MNKTKIAAIVSILVLLIAFIDTEFNLLKDAGLSLLTISRIKLIGLVLTVVLPGISTLFKNRSARK